MSTTYSIQSLAYLKLILHSAKYPSSAVTGILLGYNNPDEPTLVVISDVIPLFHHWTDLNPMMEVALNLVEIYSKSKNMKLVGLYFGNSRLDNIDIPFTTTKVADALKREFSKAIVLVIDNQKIASNTPALIPYLPSSTNWIKSTLESSNLTLTDPTIIQTALKQSKAGNYESIGDFDDYLEDVKVDWLNNKSIAVNN